VVGETQTPVLIPDDEPEIVGTTPENNGNGKALGLSLNLSHNPI